ncbi:hypothetical protein ACEWY4_027687 [Coilia grayii]|uniref:Reverse transcriptase domain-containing protein n=1 Tax=Coilia grayii TaxID=363190 RepID=A0ABD1IRT6_9TELE
MMRMTYIYVPYISHQQNHRTTTMSSSVTSLQNATISRLRAMLLCGDFNARTGLENEIIDMNDKDNAFTILPNLENPTKKSRHNPDPVTNKNGKELVHLCRGLGLYFLNGRMKGDSLGRFTYCSPLGSSVVDYAITDMNPTSINAFTVRPQLPLSDHCQINVFLKRSQQIITTNTKKLLKLNPTYKWTSGSASEFSNVANSVEITNNINTFLKTKFEPHQSDVNWEVYQVTELYHKIAIKANLLKGNPKPRSKPNKEKWFDKECELMRKNLRQLSNQKHRQPYNPEIRENYCKTLKEYKFMIRKKKQTHYNETLDEIENSINQNQFWEKLNNLNPKQRQETPLKDGEIWKAYFESLYENIRPNNLTIGQQIIKEKLHSLEKIIKDSQCPLDYEITLDELLDTLHKLKPKKACGPDSIRTEMLKHSTPELHSVLLKLFNLTLQAGCFPEVWNRGLISPIFKSGDKFDPNNCRGICVNSNLGKVFCCILNARLQAFLIKHNVLSNGQIGFLPKHRTTDHIYTLHTLINKHVLQKNKSKVFACFVDFRKAFDSIWHDGLFYKILQSGVGGKTYDVIKTMYLDNKCAIKIDNSRTDYFTQGRGVRQGCSLSPTLFNIYINELAVQLEQSTAPGLPLNNMEVKFLLFAAVAHRTRATAAPGRTRALLSEPGPDR